MARKVEGLTLPQLEEDFLQASQFASPRLPRERAIRHLAEIGNLGVDGLGKLVSEHRADCLSPYGPLFRESGLSLGEYIRKRNEPVYVMPGGGDEDDPWDESIANFLNKLGSRAPDFWQKFNSLAWQRSQELRRSGPIKGKVAVIGLGVAGSQVLSTLGPFLGEDIVAYSSEFVPAGLWGGRDFNINSSTRPSGSRLPLIGDTTMTVPWGNQGLRLWQLSTEGGLEVVCEDASTRLYPSGLKLGEAIAINSVANGSRLLFGQEVKVVQEPNEKHVTVVSNDLLTGGIYVDQFDDVIVVTGPGSDVPLGATDELLIKERKRFNRQVRRILAGKRELISLPPVTTLEGIDRAESIWRGFQNCDMELNPLKKWLENISESGLPLGIVGNGDAAKVMFERLKRLATEFNCSPDVVVIGVDPFGYEDITRPRYLETYEDYPGSVIFDPRKATSVNSDTVVRVRVGNERSRYGGVVSCVGLVRNLNYSDAEIIRDTKGFPLCRKPSENVHVTATAAGFGLSDYPEDFIRPYKNLGISENAISVTVNGTIQDRFLYWFIRNHVSEIDTRVTSGIYRPVTAALLGLR